MVVNNAYSGTGSLARAVPQENILVLRYSQDLIEELSQLAEKKHLYDAILIDVSDCGFLFTAEYFVEAAQLAKQLLELEGALVFLKSDQAVGLCRDSLSGNISFLIFENYAELFDYSPALASHVQVALGKPANQFEESTDLFQQVLMSTMPVLSREGVRVKGTMDTISKRNTVLAAIDNFTPISTVAHRVVTEQGRMTMPELLEELRELEASRAIYPVFPKIPFLVSCFKNRTPFTIKDYLLAARLVNKAQLDEMLLEIDHALRKEHITLGPLTLKKGYINGRQLEVALQDLAFYGQEAAREQVKLVKSSAEESQIHTLLGRLGTTDPSNLLQNLAQNRESGVLSVEYRDLHFRATFEAGRLVHAKVGKIMGDQAVLEFASAWREGIFVFVQRMPPEDLAKDACKLTKLLEKLLLDSALAKDKLAVVLKKLPKGTDTVLEKNSDDSGFFSQASILDPIEKTPLKPREVEVMKRLSAELDGLTSLVNAVKKLADVTTYDGVTAAARLLHYNLVSVPEMDLTVPLEKYRQLCRRVAEKIGVERNLAFLRLSLRETMSYSVRAAMFALTSSGEVGVDMAAARSTGASLSLLIKDIEDWQVKYIEYVSQEINSEVLLSFIEEVHQQ